MFVIILVTLYNPHIHPYIGLHAWWRWLNEDGDDDTNDDDDDDDDISESVMQKDNDSLILGAIENDRQNECDHWDDAANHWNYGQNYVIQSFLK